MTVAGLNRSAAQLLAVLAPDTVVLDIYSERGSQVYDAMTVGDDSEIREILRIARHRAGSILELACGSGRLALPLARLGRETVAIDNSPRMLELLAQKAEGARLGNLHPVLGDMSDFHLDAEFGLIVLATTSVSLLTAPQRASLFTRVREHLAPDGVFVISAHSTKPRDDDREAMVVQTGAAEVVFLSDEVDAHAGTRDVSVIQLRRRDGLIETEAFASRVQLIDVEEIVDELRAAGLSVGDVLPVRFSEGSRRISMIECSL